MEMTREEAYNRIDAIIAKNEIDDDYVTITSMLDYDALRMARKALEQEPCDDAISRQAVLEYIEGSEADLWHSSENELVCQDIKELPPVTPQPKTGHWVDDKCSICGKGIEDLIDSREWYKNESPNYCPFCGIKIVDEQESEE